MKILAWASITAVLAAISIAAPAADDVVKQDAAQAVVDRAFEDAAKERRKYDDAVRKITERAVTALKKEVEKQTKAGNLKAALGVQAKLDEVQNGAILAQVDADARKAEAPAGAKAGLVVKSAKFGIRDVWHDCTDDIRALVKDGRLTFTSSQALDISLATKHGDPSPGFVESIVVEYQTAEGVKTVTVPPNGTVNIP